MPTDPRSSAAVGRLYDALAEALTRRGGAPAADVTVSEIYQTLVPYARARAELGFEMNADYEHALMRLLAGEGGFARLEQPEARAQVARELESPHPDVTLYRRFAASTVRLSAAPSPSPSRGSVDVASPPSPGNDDVAQPPGPGEFASPPASGPIEIPEPATTSRYVSVSETDGQSGASTSASRIADRSAAPPAGEVKAASGMPAFEEESWGKALEQVAAARSRETGSGAAGGAAEPRDPAGGAPDSDGRDGAGEADLVVRAERALDHGLARLSTLLEGSHVGGSADEGEDDAPTGATPVPRAATRPDACGSCGRGLPSDRDARFCPYCGSEQPTVCAACGDDLAPDWRYCPSCGTDAGDATPDG